MDKVTSDIHAAIACYDLYWNTAVFSNIINQGGVYCSVRNNRVTFRGSTTREDWIHDLESVRLISVPGLGNIGDGFYDGMAQVYAQIVALLDKTNAIEVCGHSLGAAHAQIFSLMYMNENPDAKLECVVFGCPNVGDDSFKTAFSKVTCRSYDNGQDIVTVLPKAILGQKPVQASELIPIYCQPVELDGWFMAKYHHEQLYLAGMARYINE